MLHTLLLLPDRYWFMEVYLVLMLAMYPSKDSSEQSALPMEKVRMSMPLTGSGVQPKSIARHMQMERMVFM